MQGKAWKFGDDISTDLIAPARYFHLRSNLPELAKHVMEDADPSFAQKVKAGDFIVAGRNFGLGSSREHAPTIIKLAGVRAVLAVSFARIFFRNAINLGLPVIECDTGGIKTGDILEIELSAGTVRNLTGKTEIKFVPLKGVMNNILQDGGLISHVAQHNGFKID